MALKCPVCNEYSMVPRSRSIFEWLRFAEIDECPRCGCIRLQTHADRHPAFSVIARCPRCGTPDLRVRRFRAEHDPLYRNPVSLILGHLGGALMHCVDCPLQFYDLRPMRRRKRA